MLIDEFFVFAWVGRRSQIYLALSTAAEFRDHLSSFSDFYSSLGPPNPDTVPEDGKLKSEVMVKANVSPVLNDFGIIATKSILHIFLQLIGIFYYIYSGDTILTLR